MNLYEKNVKELTKADWISIGDRIRNERKKNNLSAVDFSELLGIGKDQLSKIENGRGTCTIRNLHLISQYLNVSIDELVTGKRNHLVELENLMENKSVDDINRFLDIAKAYFQ